MLQQVAHAGGWISNNCFNTGSLGLNLLDPVSCRGLFALFALSFDIRARRRAGTCGLPLPGRHAYRHTFIVICCVDRWTDDPTDDRPARVRAPPVCVMRTGPPRRRRAHNQSTSG